MTLEEVFVEETYDFAAVVQPNTILDLGSNVGMSVIYFRCKYPAAEITAYEPNPVAFRRLTENTRGMSNVTLWNQAVADHNGTTAFHVGAATVHSSLFSRPELTSQVNVECRTLDTILAGLPGSVDLLKFDIEGGECTIFSAAQNLKSVRHIVGELHTGFTDVGVDALCEPFNEDFEVAVSEHSPVQYHLLATNRAHRP